MIFYSVGSDRGKFSEWRWAVG